MRLALHGHARLTVRLRFRPDVRGHGLDLAPEMNTEKATADASTIEMRDQSALRGGPADESLERVLQATMLSPVDRIFQMIVAPEHLLIRDEAG
jgi:hypothetical protein